VRLGSTDRAGPYTVDVDQPDPGQLQPTQYLLGLLRCRHRRGPGPRNHGLGTGAKLRFPRPEVTRPLAEARVGFEAMDTKAACRTFNILMAEGRRVVAAILL